MFAGFAVQGILRGFTANRPPCAGKYFRIHIPGVNVKQINNSRMIGVCDCNNFFVSCERVFNPSLNGEPVVVLSNNDGCIISRSNEAKRLGIKMGQPYFQIKRFCDENGVKIFSSNYALYSDMSHRVMTILRETVPHIEVYSVDEAFIGFGTDDTDIIGKTGRYIVDRVRR